MLIIYETKLDGSFPTRQFLINGFNEQSRQIRNRNGGRTFKKIHSKIKFGINPYK